MRRSDRVIEDEKKAILQSKPRRRLYKMKAARETDMRPGPLPIALDVLPQVLRLMYVAAE